MRKGWAPEWAEWVSQDIVEAMREQWTPELPPIDRGAYLIGFLFEAGPVMDGGMSAAQLTWGEIDRWCNRVGVDLQPWESRALRRLSAEYANESQKATERYAPAPWLRDDEIGKPRVTSVQESLRALARDV